MSSPLECAEQIEALAEKATPGIWDVCGIGVTSDVSPTHAELICSPENQADKDFIAEIHQLAPEAARHIRELQALIDSYAKTQADLGIRLVSAEQSIEAWKKSDVGQADQLIRDLVSERNYLQDRLDKR